MREIKFRAWDNAKKRFIYFTLEEVISARVIDLHKKMEICQFTGLKDMNGRDIYEGDIIKINIGGYWQNQLEVVKWDWYGWQPFIDGLEDKYYFIKECEVVGNIYENPDLIQEGK